MCYHLQKKYFIRERGYFMKKSKFMFVIMLLFMLLISACQSSDKELTIGVIEDGTYKNDYFGISLSFPKEWESNSAGAFGQDTNNKIVPIDELKVGEADSSTDLANADMLDLFRTSKYPLDGGESGPSVNVTAMKLGQYEGISNSKEFIELLQKSLGPPYELKEVTTTEIGGKSVDVVKVTLEHNGVTRSQDAYILTIHDYVINVVASYIDDESHKETNQILQSISFK